MAETTEFSDRNAILQKRDLKEITLNNGLSLEVKEDLPVDISLKLDTTSLALSKKPYKGRFYRYFCIKDQAKDYLGFTAVEIYPSKMTARIANREVFPEQRNKGLGTLLREQVNNWALEFGVSSIISKIPLVIEVTRDDQIISGRSHHGGYDSYKSFVRSGYSNGGYPKQKARIADVQKEKDSSVDKKGSAGVFVESIYYEKAANGKLIPQILKKPMLPIDPADIYQYLVKKAPATMAKLD